MLKVKIYTEDTDHNGMVYHANHLRYFERARSEHLNQLGLLKQELFKEDGLRFVVHSLEMKYLKPLLLEETYLVSSQLKCEGCYRFIFDQCIFSTDDKKFANARVTVALIDDKNKLVAIPQTIVEKVARRPHLGPVIDSDFRYQQAV